MNRKYLKSVIVYLSGFLSGIIITALAVWILMPTLMISVHESKFDDVDQTCMKLREAIEANGWSNTGIRNMNKAMSKHGVEMQRPVRIVELCKADYAKKVLMTNPEVSTLMPCAWGVYKGNDGKVYIAGMNMGLMGKLFGGNISKVMGNYVAEDEKKILEHIVTNPK